jgi:exoribonuclease R
MAEKKINYLSRNFADVRTELLNFIRKYYPEIFSDFSDSSIGTMMVELNAAVADMLSHHTDRMFQETQIDYAQKRKSLLSMARTLGVKVPG